MNQRLPQLLRMAHVRALQQQSREAECARAQARVHSTMRSLEHVHVAGLAAASEGSRALSSGDTSAWMLSCAVREVAEWNRTQLATQRTQCETELQQRQLELARSRMDVQRCDSVLSRIRVAANVVEQRRQQAESDDRFASRQRWASSMNSC